MSEAKKIVIAAPEEMMAILLMSLLVIFKSNHFSSVDMITIIMAPIIGIPAYVRR